MRDKQVHASGEENVGDAVRARCFMWSQFFNGPVYLLIGDAAEFEAGGWVVSFWVVWVNSFKFQEEHCVEELALGFVHFGCLGCFRSILSLHNLERAYLGSSSIHGVA